MGASRLEGEGLGLAGRGRGDSVRAHVPNSKFRTKSKLLIFLIQIFEYCGLKIDLWICQFPSVGGERMRRTKEESVAAEVGKGV